jgi:hypothetical protein
MSWTPTDVSSNQSAHFSFCTNGCKFRTSHVLYFIMSWFLKSPPRRSDKVPYRRWHRRKSVGTEFLVHLAECQEIPGWKFRWLGNPRWRTLGRMNYSRVVVSCTVSTRFSKGLRPSTRGKGRSASAKRLSSKRWRFRKFTNELQKELYESGLDKKRTKCFFNVTFRPWILVQTSPWSLLTLRIGASIGKLILR